LIFRAFLHVWEEFC